MSREGQPEDADQQETHVESVEQLRGVIQAKLIDGSYDVLRNGHEDTIIITDGDHSVAHHLTRDEAASLERAIWSAGEDQTLEALVARVMHDLGEAHFDLRKGIDVTVSLQAEAA